MTQTEIICESCDQHYIILVTNEEEPLYCPFCRVGVEDYEEVD